MAHVLEGIFHIHERGGTVSREVLGGVTHFLGNLFNLVATASVLKVGGLPFVDGVAGGVWVMCISQLFVGLFSNLPISVSAGAGPNLTVAYLLAQSLNTGGLGSYNAALTVCMTSGILISILTYFGAITAITNLVPTSLKLAIGVGIGLLCSFVGFQQVHMVVRSDEGLIGPGDFLNNAEIWFSLGGLLFLTLLNARRIPGAVLCTMVLLTLLDWSVWTGWPVLKLDRVKLPTIYMPDLQLFYVPNFWIQVSAMAMMLVFDAMGCIFGLSKLAGLMDTSTGEVDGGNGFFHALGLGTAAAGFIGISPIVVNGASAAAISEGSRTGLSTCVSGLLSLLALPLSSALAAMPPCTSSFVLVYVGVSMSAEAAHIAWDDPIEAVPAFLCIICQPFLFSVADGIYMGLVASLVLYTLSGRAFGAAPKVANVSPRTPPSWKNSIFLPNDGFIHANYLPYNGILRKKKNLGDQPLLSASDPFGEGIWSI
mmetsp:Transcript_105763/g.165056  ORF Transcript_105763/g.165056 Transcript_105763/m.165056 type:complete len:482 (-) Transcript_105763:57-1502(-)